jgi:hypothetical protein
MHNKPRVGIIPRPNKKREKEEGQKATLRKSYNNKPDYSATKREEEGLTGSLYPIS